MVYVDFHYTRNLIFWINVKSKIIYSALLELNQKSLIVSSNPQQLPALPRLQLHKVRPVIRSGLANPAGLSVDWINNRLYWTDCGSSRIEFASLEGGSRKIFFKHSVHRPNSIVVNPERSTVYWSDWGDPPRIESAFMDGTDRKVLVSSLLSMPTSLVIDYPAYKLYWVDIKQSMIECANLDGSSRYTILHQHIYNPISLSIFEDNLYWTSLRSSQVSTVNKLTGLNVTTININDDLSDFRSELQFDIKVYHMLRQPEVIKHPCQYHQCSHLCLPNNITYQCSCPFGYIFESNNRQKCQKDTVNSILAFTHRNDIRAMFVSMNKYPTESSSSSSVLHDYNIDYVLPLSHISFAVSLAYDPFTSTIYWTDLLNKSISRAKWSGKQQDTLVDTSLESPSGLAYDWSAANLYWVDTSRNVIEVAKENGSFRTLVVWRSLDQPRDVVLDPGQALMFWSQWSNHTANIERAGMDGSYRIILHSLNLTRPHGLALDVGSRRIYWADSSQSTIEFSFYGNPRIKV